MRAAGGESVVITDHGHPIARIVPFRASILEQLVAEGRVTPADGDLLVRLDELGLPGKVVGTEPSKALEELRADEA